MLRRQRKRVAPLDGSITVEVREGRHLRVQHFNACPRDAKFENEMQLYIQYRQTGIRSSGPLVMSRKPVSNLKRKSVDCGDERLQNSHPNFIQDKNEMCSGKKTIGLDKVAACATDDAVVSLKRDPESPKSGTRILDSASLSSSVFSSPSHQTASEHVRSASSVQLALHVKNQQQQQQTLIQKIQTSLPADIAETESESKDQNSWTNVPESTKENVGDGLAQDNIVALSSTGPFTLEAMTNQVSVHSTSVNSQSHKTGQDPQPPAPEDGANNVDSVEPTVHKDLALFFIHGVGGSSDIWCAQTKYFSDLGFEVILPDLIGHGFSGTPKQAKAYHFKEIAADLESLFDKYCKRKNVVIGHSYGASFASHLGRYRPRRVSKLILISGGPPTPLAPQPGVFSLPTCLLTCISPCLRRGFYKGAFHNKRTPVLPKEEAFNIPTYVLQNTMNGQDWPEGDEIFHNWLTCPCLLVYGSEDKLVSLKEEQEMAETIFDSHLEVIQDASHMVMMEAPDDVNQLIHAFILQSSSLVSPTARNNNATTNASISDTPREPPPPLSQRSKSRLSQRSLKSGKGQRSLPHNLLSKSFKT
ncbi:uncharacterized protein LOC101852461 [Aplysia californica]|uniref:acylglycerol lipase n=1 Tax=Aplysia californica TaxID=6500 RepID=A0ABM0JIE9_APLCA|nr:uncharacterized protein LOC101852461 [Aplysia californica]XP_012935700.1 uncharacterized protein LOC101852461 [Aplysia californica]XP_012935701.1 uncharacterized protein LOC101852461 [Aplysia californica]